MLDKEASKSNSNQSYCEFNKELEALKAIFLDELIEETIYQENKTDSECVTKFSVNLFPSTADKINEQYVKLTLNFTVPNKYPELIPNFEIKNARGLSEEKIQKFKETLETMANEKKGSNMLHDLISYVKESLTSDNFPVGPCMVCLYEFTRDDIYVVTKCFHHFHSRCLANYIEKGKTKENKETKENNSKNDENNLMPCPVCRDNSDLTHLVSEPANSYPPPTLSQKPLTEEQNLLKEAKQQQEKFASIYEKQQEKGGIIDNEAEKNRFLIKISNADKGLNNAELSTNSSSSEYHSSDEHKPEDDQEEKKVNKDDSKDTEKLTKEDAHSAQEEKEENKTFSDEKNSHSTCSKDDSTSKDDKSQEKEKIKTEGKEDKENKPSTSRRSRSSRGRNRRRARSGQAQTSSASKVEENIQNGTKRPRSRRQKNNSNINYSRSYRNGVSQTLRGNSARGRNRYRYTGGGLASPPYRHNFGSFSYNEKNYQEETARDQDRPGYYAARVFRSANQNRNSLKTEDLNSHKPSESDLTAENEIKGRSLSENRKLKKNGNQNRSKRYNNVSDYQNSNKQYLNSMQTGMKPRQNYQQNYQQNYRTQNNYAARNYGYNGRNNNYANYQNYNTTYGSGYAAGYATGYGYDVYYDFNNYNRNNYINGRINYRARNYQANGYRQRKRNDTLQSHSSSKNENHTCKNVIEGPETSN